MRGETKEKEGKNKEKSREFEKEIKMEKKNGRTERWERGRKQGGP